MSDRKNMIAELRAIAERWRWSARGLRQEVENGVALRQSAESKLARADVHEAHAAEVEAWLIEAGQRVLAVLDADDGEEG